jgi:hypothetical protein
MKFIHLLYLLLVVPSAFILPTTAAAGPPGADTTFWVGDTTFLKSWNKRHPFVEFGYGLDQAHHKRLGAGFPSTGMMEVKAGYLVVDTLENGLLSLDQSFLVGSWYNSNLGGETGGPDEITGKLARFGLGHGENYGYDLGGSSIVPYFQSTAAWTELTTGRPTTLSQDDIEILDRYEGTFRFGASAESGIRANIGRTISLSGGYEAGVVYPRIVFWELAGSYVVVGAANGVVSWFGKDMVDSSPTLGPIFLFLIRSGVTWGVYQLWREDMNWPFASETPLTHETLKFNLSFTL